MKFLYLDDSGNSGVNLDDKEQPLFVLGGVVINADKWVEIHEHIEKIKRQYDIQNKELHAIEIINGKGIFKKFDIDKKYDLIKELLQIIVDFELDIISFEIKKINYKTYFEKNFSPALQKMVKVPPYLLAYSYILQIFEQYLNENKQNGILIADEQDAKTLANDTLGVLRAIDQPEIRIEKIIEKSFFINSKESNLIQLADICVYCIKRYKEIELKNIENRSLEPRKKFFEIIEKNIYKPKFDLTKHKILSFLMKNDELK